MERRRIFALLWPLIVGLLLLAISWWQDKLLLDESAWDSIHYRELSDVNLFRAEMLADYRTLGYPLFLQLVRVLGSPDLSAVPYWQWGIGVLAAMTLGWGLMRLVMPPHAAMLTASAVLINVYLLNHYNNLMTDSLGLSAAIAALGLLLVWLSDRTRYSVLIALALVVFLAYQIRPIYLYLVGLLPLLGVLIVPVFQSAGERWSQTWRAAFRLTAATALPLLAFCLLRFVAVGDFQLVSFGGFAMTGSSAQLLTEEMVPALPEDLRPLAEEIIERRKTTELDTRLGKRVWHPPYEATTIRLKEFNAFHSPIAWSVVRPAALEIYDGDWVAANAALGRLSWHVRSQSKVIMPAYFFRQSTRAARYSYRAFFGSPIEKPIVWVSLVLVALQVLQRLRKAIGRTSAERVGTSASSNIADSSADSATRNQQSTPWRMVYVCFLLSVGLFASNTFVILMTQEPLDRTISPATVLWPLPLLAMILLFWPKGLAEWTHRFSPVRSAPNFRSS